MELELFKTELADMLNLLDIFSEVDDNAVFVDSVTASNVGIFVKLSDKSEFQLIPVKLKG